MRRAISLLVGVRAFAIILGLAIAGLGGLRAMGPRVTLPLVEEIEAHFAVLVAETDLAEARTAWAEGAFMVITPGTVLPVTGAGEHLWTRVVWRNQAAVVRHVAVRIVDTFEDETTFYFETEAGDVVVKRAGENVSLAERDLGGREPAVAWRFGPGETVTAWIDNGREDSVWPLYDVACDLVGHRAAMQRQEVAVGFYYGFLVALILYNLFVYWVLRWSEIRTFVWHAVAFGAAFYFYQGLHFTWLPQLQSPLHNWVVGALCVLVVVTVGAFTRDFLGLRKGAPGLDRWVRASMWSGAGAVALNGVAVAWWLVHPGWVAEHGRLYLGMFAVMAVVIAVGYLTAAVVGVVMWRRGRREARFFVLGFGLALVLFTPGLLENMVGRPAQSAHEWIQFGSGLELVFFALALVDKIRIMRDERNAAEQRVRRETAARERLEEAHAQIVRQAEELAAMSRHKSEFLGIAAHQLRNPLSALGITLQMLREEVTRPDGGRLAAEECAELLDEATVLAARMEARVATLLTAEALESGSIAVALQAYAVGDLVRGAAEQCRRAAQEKGVSCELRVEEEVLVQVDPERSMEVLVNLMSNAVKYSPQGGQVTVRVSAVGPDERRPVAVWVADSGPGFTAEDRARLFGRFQRLSAKPTGGEPSSGLGLFIARRMAELQDARLTLESGDGEPACFRLDLRVPEPGSMSATAGRAG